jgi:S1-C subfamily serine protease
LILGLLSQPTAKLSQLTKTSDQPRPAVVRVNTDDGAMSSHGTGTCVAWTVDYGLILTAWHVIKDNQGQITVDFWYKGQDEPERIDATVVATSRTLDLAALVVKRPKFD